MGGGYGTRMGTPVLLTHPSSLAHDTGGHPEQAARIPAVLRALEERDWLGWDRIESPEVELARLEAVHPSAYVDGIERLCRGGGGWIDADTVVSEGSYEAALHSAGGAVEMVSLLCSGAVPVAFSVHRPPGHHAEAA